MLWLSLIKSKRIGNGRYKDVPYKRMHYLPLIPRFKRLYESMSSTTHMRWHYENKRNDGIMTHPSHSEARQHFDQTFPEFASDPRNARLMLCTDGFTPIINLANLIHVGLSWLPLITFFMNYA